MSRIAVLSRSLGLALALTVGTVAQAASPFVFTYGGRLTNGDEAVKGPVELEIKFYRHATSTTAANLVPVSPVIKSGVALDDGVFQIDITNLTPAEMHLIFASNDRTWIEVTDKTNGRTYPRQMVTTVPYALKVPVDGKTVTFNSDGSLTALPGTVAGAGQFLTTDGSGAFKWDTPSTSASALGGIAVNAPTPSSGQVLTYQNGKWEPSTLSGGGNMVAANNLSELTDAAAARTNLALGNAAVKNVGSSAGMVAAGDDARFSDARIPTGSAGGDLVGSYPNPTIAGNAVATAKIADGAVTSAKIADGTVAGADIANASIQGTHIVGGAIQGSHLAGAINFTTTGNIGAAVMEASTLVSKGNGVKYYNPGQSNYITLTAPTTGLTTSYALKLPTGQGGVGTTLVNDGAGNLSWGAGGGGGGLTSGGIISGVNANALLFADQFGALTTSMGLGWEDSQQKLTVQGQVGIGTTNPTASLDVRGSFALNVRDVNSSGTYAVQADDYFLGITASNISITLPNCSAPFGRMLVIARIAGGTTTFTGGAFVNGAPSLSSMGTSTTLICVSAGNWFVRN